jgi:mRNA-degrading endonuclease HigB of HigAB toxin-antitoxin module
MNAAEQANSVERVSKIAAVVNLFKSQFPQITADLSPWLKNAETAKFDDPHSIDLAFHFPCRNFACQSQTILMQIRLPGTTDTDS